MDKKEHKCDCQEKNKEDCCKKNKDCCEDDCCENMVDFNQKDNQTNDTKDLTEELNVQCAELKGTLQRVYAEFQNYKKRTQEEKQKSAELASENVIKKLLPLIDDFERALKYKTQENDFSKGMEMIYSQLIQIIEDEGVKAILPNGKFNPKLHEVLLTEESDREEGVILEELQKGYMLGGKVIRHSKVKIAK